MGDYRVNKTALDDTLRGMHPYVEERLVQEPVTRTANPFYAMRYAVGTVGWQRIECTGYELLVLAGDEVQQLGSEPAYVRFGTGGPSSTSLTTNTEGAIPVIPGTRIKVPQGFSEVWFLPSAAVSWRLVIVKKPHVNIDYGPYGWELPGVRPQSVQTIDDHVNTDDHKLPVVEPSTATDGVALPARCKDVILRFYERFKENP